MSSSNGTAFKWEKHRVDDVNVRLDCVETLPQHRILVAVSWVKRVGPMLKSAVIEVEMAAELMTPGLLDEKCKPGT